MIQYRKALELWRETFFPYQLQWIEDPARFCIAVKSRQIGFSHGTAGGCVLGGLCRGRPQIILSASQDLSDEVLDKARRHAKLLALFGYAGADDFVTDSATEISWRNGGRIVALPASPRTARSFTGDVWLDEFAYHLDPKGIRDAAFPIALRGDWRIRVFSTPDGAQGLFHQLATAPGPLWSVHRVTLKQAIAEGVPIDLESAYALAGGDARLIEQWYNCGFLDGDLQYYPSAYLERMLRWDGEIPDLTDATLHAGFDVGRTRDLSVLVVVALIRGIAYVLAVIEMPRTRFRAQRQQLDSAREMFRWDTIHIDATGLGSELAEGMEEDWGSEEVHAVQFTAPTKEKLFTGAFRWLSNGRVRAPLDVSGAALVSEGKTIRRIISDHGNVSYSAPSGSEGHADRFTGLCLALQGASEPIPTRGMSVDAL
jgi:phage FluMu gp28-like protein